MNLLNNMELLVVCYAFVAGEQTAENTIVFPSAEKKMPRSCSLNVSPSWGYTQPRQGLTSLWGSTIKPDRSKCRGRRGQLAQLLQEWASYRRERWWWPLMPPSAPAPPSPNLFWHRPSAGCLSSPLPSQCFPPCSMLPLPPSTQARPNNTSPSPFRRWTTVSQPLASHSSRKPPFCPHLSCHPLRSRLEDINNNNPR